MNRTIYQLIAGRALVRATEQATVADAARLMRSAKVGAVLVMKRERIVGIFTERDAINRVVAEGLDPAQTRLSRVMTPKPFTIESHKPFAHALVLMRENGFRHVPVVEGSRAVGMVSLRDALASEMQALEADMRHREHIANILG
jgi:CBS domain-containing protein